MTQADLHNSILKQMRAEGRSEQDIQQVAVYLTGRKLTKKGKQ